MDGFFAELEFDVMFVDRSSLDAGFSSMGDDGEEEVEEEAAARGAMVIARICRLGRALLLDDDEDCSPAPSPNMLAARRGGSFLALLLLPEALDEASR